MYPLAGSTGRYVVNWFLDMKGKVLVQLFSSTDILNCISGVWLSVAFATPKQLTCSY